MGGLSPRQRNNKAKPAAVPAFTDDKHFGKAGCLFVKTSGERAGIEPCRQIVVLETNRPSLYPTCEIKQAVASQFIRFMRQNGRIYTQTQNAMYRARRNTMCDRCGRPYSC